MRPVLLSTTLLLQTLVCWGHRGADPGSVQLCNNQERSCCGGSNAFNTRQCHVRYRLVHVIKLVGILKRLGPSIIPVTTLLFRNNETLCYNLQGRRVGVMKLADFNTGRQHKKVPTGIAVQWLLV